MFDKTSDFVWKNGHRFRCLIEYKWWHRKIWRCLIIKKEYYTLWSSVGLWVKKIFTRILIIFSINWKYTSNLFSSFYSLLFFLKKDFKGAEVLHQYELHLEVPDRCPIKLGDSVQFFGEDLQQFGYKQLNCCDTLHIHSSNHIQANHSETHSITFSHIYLITK